MYENTSRTTIAEFYNGAPDETFFDQIRETGVTQIHTFFSDLWPHIKGNIYIRHETFDKVLVDSTKVVLKVDYISQDPGGILIITDWKTGAEMEDSPINRLQMGVYVLWASEYFQKDPRDIRSELNFLSTGSIHPYLFTETDLDDIWALITDEFRIMNSTLNTKNSPAIRVQTIVLIVPSKPSAIKDKIIRSYFSFFTDIPGLICILKARNIPLPLSSCHQDLLSSGILNLVNQDR